jgi:hypothetical protein
MTFILILTLMGPWNDSPRVVTQVPGFKSAQACKAAGDAWLRPLAAKWQATAYALCVPQ